ncbi:MAG: iron-containing alcohol dehydrogenase [Bacteroidales bacterium]
MEAFKITRIPEIIFGAGKIDLAGKLAAGFGKTAILVTGEGHLKRSGDFDRVVKSLREAGLYIISISFQNEPSPDFVDSVVMEHRNRNIGVVVAVGGGSVVDGGKAISAMLLQEKRVKTYLEGVGTGEVHDGRKIPFIAVPTTSGTGSEATKNAVLSSVSEDGFKKSLRHDNFVPDIALIDPGLMLSIPPDVTASTGMDAIVQLLESYVSTKANPMTDALAWSGLEHAAANFPKACSEGASDVNVRAGMAYAALMSGIALANAGMGVVHGFASVIGGYFRIPHGVVCGTLFAPSVKNTIENLLRSDPESVFLEKYSRAGYLLSGKKGSDTETGCALLVDTLYEWSRDLSIPKLGKYGIESFHFDMILNETGQKNNPALLSRKQLKAILEERL